MLVASDAPWDEDRHGDCSRRPTSPGHFQGHSARWRARVSRSQWSSGVEIKMQLGCRDHNGARVSRSQCSSGVEITMQLGCRDHNGARDACRVMPRCREPRRRRWERRGDRAVENARRPVTRAAAAPMHTDRAPRRGPGVAARQNRLRCSAVGAAEVAAWRCRRPCPAARPAMPPSMTCNTPDAKLTCQTRLLTQPRQARVAVAAAAAAEQRWSRLGVDARHPGS